MNQAGIYRILLYENKDLVIDYDNKAITNNGLVIELFEYARLEIEPIALVNKYKILAEAENLINTDIININNSIYGWIAKFDFLDLSTKIITKPFFDEKLKALNTNQYNSRELTLTTWSKQGLIAFD